MPGMPQTVVDGLVERLGPMSARAAQIPVLLAREPRTLAELITSTGLSRRTVEAVLELCDARPDGDRYRLDPLPDGVAAHARPRDRQVDHSPGSPTLRGRADDDLLAVITRWIDEAPPARRDFDHVAAAPETVLRRARWLDEQYDLATTPLLFVGDHDLTALATCLVNPAARAAVVDIDEALLAHIDRIAGETDLAIVTRYADLRFGLPPDLVGAADVVFTDPPYTPEGVRLFALQGLRGLRHRGYGHVVIAYGTGDGQPALGLKVQQALANLGLYIEALMPRFNRYRGAQAVGSASDLYVLRATARTWRHVDRADPRADGATAIYTHGAQSLESVPQRLPGTADLLDGEIAGVVGDAWPDGLPHTRLATFLGTGLPPAIRRRPGTVLVDLSADPGPWLLRALLVSTVERLVIVIPEQHLDLDAPPMAWMELKYAVELRRRHPGAGLATLTATPVPAGDMNVARRVQRHVLDRATSVLATVWREGLVRHAGISREEARSLVSDADRGRLMDLPRHRIGAALDEIASSSQQ